MHLTTFNYLPAAALAAAAAFLRAMKRSRADMTAVSSFRFAALACEKKSTNSGPRFLLPLCLGLLLTPLSAAIGTLSISRWRLRAGAAETEGRRTR